MTERLGRYELVRTVGEGGTARVYEARLHGPMGFCKPVALKVLDVNAPGDRFTEARMGALLQHPNVVATYAVEELNGRCCIAMEYVRGPSARALIVDGGLSDRAVVELGLQVLDGLEHIHEHGLVHRDIKPANLLVAPGGYVKITDLGIARPVGASQTASGTYGYMPAEQCNGDATPVSDVFALGATLFRLRQGESLFGRGQMSLANSTRADAFLAEGGHLEVVAHEGLRAFIARCVRQHPDDRFQTAPEAHQALSALIGTRLQGPSLSDVVGEHYRPELTEMPMGQTLPGRDVVGRSALVVDLMGQARVSGWLTLFGVSGVGKSTVARQVCDALSGRFVDADGADGCADLAVAVALATQQPVSAADEGLSGVLRGASGVVVLDHLDGLNGWREAVAKGLHPALIVVCVASSVEAPWPREARVEVPPLDDEAALAMYCGLRGLSTVEPEVVEAFDGLPLAIELGAARHDSITREHTGPARHGSLQASLAATWRWLPEWAPVALAQLSAFADGFTMRAAAAVLDADGPAPLVVLERLQSSGLLRYDRLSDRFRLPRHVRSYASDFDGMSAAVGRVRHGVWFAQLGVRSALMALHHPDSAELRERVVAEVRELEVAVQRAVAGNDADVAHGCALAAAWVYVFRGPARKGEEVLQRAEVLDGPRLCEVKLRQTYFCILAGNLNQALEQAARGREEARRSGRKEMQVQAELRLGQCLVRLGDLDDAEQALHRGLQGATQLEDINQQAVALTLLGSISTRRGDVEGALETMESCAVLFGASGSANSEIVARSNVGLLATSLGRDAQALASMERARDLAVEMDNPRRQASTTIWITEVHLRAGDLDAGRTELARAESLLLQVDDELLQARTQTLRGGVMLLEGDVVKACAVIEKALVAIEVADAEEADAVRIELAEGYLLAGRVDDARREIRKALKGLLGQRWRREIAHLLALRARARGSADDLTKARKLLAGLAYHPRIDRALATAERQLD